MLRLTFRGAAIGLMAALCCIAFTASHPRHFSGPHSPYGFAADAAAVVGADQSSFSCAELQYGYYADQALDCKVFHICMPNTAPSGRQREPYRFSFFCPNQTRFSQDSRTCIAQDRAFPCHSAHLLYGLNSVFGQAQQEAANKQLIANSSFSPRATGASSIQKSRNSNPRSTSLQTNTLPRVPALQSLPLTDSLDVSKNSEFTDTGITQSRSSEDVSGIDDSAPSFIDSKLDADEGFTLSSKLPKNSGNAQLSRQRQDINPRSNNSPLEQSPSLPSSLSDVHLLNGSSKTRAQSAGVQENIQSIPRGRKVSAGTQPILVSQNSLPEISEEPIPEPESEPEPKPEPKPTASSGLVKSSKSSTVLSEPVQRSESQTPSLYSQTSIQSRSQLSQIPSSLAPPNDANANPSVVVEPSTPLSATGEVPSDILSQHSNNKLGIKATNANFETNAALLSSRAQAPKLALNLRQPAAKNQSNSENNDVGTNQLSPIEEVIPSDKTVFVNPRKRGGNLSSAKPQLALAGAAVLPQSPKKISFASLQNLDPPNALGNSEAEVPSSGSDRDAYLSQNNLSTNRARNLSFRVSDGSQRTSNDEGKIGINVATFGAWKEPMSSLPPPPLFQNQHGKIEVFEAQKPNLNNEEPIKLTEISSSEVSLSIGNEAKLYNPDSGLTTAKKINQAQGSSGKIPGFSPGIRRVKGRVIEGSSAIEGVKSTSRSVHNSEGTRKNRPTLNVGHFDENKFHAAAPTIPLKDERNGGNNRGPEQVIKTQPERTAVKNNVQLIPSQKIQSTLEVQLPPNPVTQSPKSGQTPNSNRGRSRSRGRVQLVQNNIDLKAREIVTTKPASRDLRENINPNALVSSIEIMRFPPSKGHVVKSSHDLEILLDDDLDAATASLLAGIQPPRKPRQKKDSSSVEASTDVRNNASKIIETEFGLSLNTVTPQVERTKFFNTQQQIPARRTAAPNSNHLGTVGSVNTTKRNGQVNPDLLPTTTTTTTTTPKPRTTRLPRTTTEGYVSTRRPVNDKRGSVKFTPSPYLDLSWLGPSIRDQITNHLTRGISGKRKTSINDINGNAETNKKSLTGKQGDAHHTRNSRTFAAINTNVATTTVATEQKKELLSSNHLTESRTIDELSSFGQNILIPEGINQSSRRRVRNHRVKLRVNPVDLSDDKQQNDISSSIIDSIKEIDHKENNFDQVHDDGSISSSSSARNVQLQKDRVVSSDAESKLTNLTPTSANETQTPKTLISYVQEEDVLYGNSGSSLKETQKDRMNISSTLNTASVDNQPEIASSGKEVEPVVATNAHTLVSSNGHEDTPEKPDYVITVAPTPTTTVQPTKETTARIVNSIAPFPTEIRGHETALPPQAQNKARRKVVKLNRRPLPVSNDYELSEEPIVTEPSARSVTERTARTRNNVSVPQNELKLNLDFENNTSDYQAVTARKRIRQRRPVTSLAKLDNSSGTKEGVNTTLPAKDVPSPRVSRGRGRVFALVPGTASTQNNSIHEVEGKSKESITSIKTTNITTQHHKTQPEIPVKESISTLTPIQESSQLQRGNTSLSPEDGSQGSQLSDESQYSTTQRSLRNDESKYSTTQRSQLRDESHYSTTQRSQLSDESQYSTTQRSLRNDESKYSTTQNFQLRDESQYSTTQRSQLRDESHHSTTQRSQLRDESQYSTTQSSIRIKSRRISTRRRLISDAPLISLDSDDNKLHAETITTPKLVSQRVRPTTSQPQVDHTNASHFSTTEPEKSFPNSEVPTKHSKSRNRSQISSPDSLNLLPEASVANKSNDRSNVIPESFSSTQQRTRESNKQQETYSTSSSKATTTASEESSSTTELINIPKRLRTRTRGQVAPNLSTITSDKTEKDQNSTIPSTPPQVPAPTYPVRRTSRRRLITTKVAAGQNASEVNQTEARNKVEPGNYQHVFEKQSATDEKILLKQERTHVKDGGEENLRDNETFSSVTTSTEKISTTTSINFSDLFKNMKNTSGDDLDDEIQTISESQNTRRTAVRRRIINELSGTPWDKTREEENAAVKPNVSSPSSRLSIRVGEDIPQVHTDDVTKQNVGHQDAYVANQINNREKEDQNSIQVHSNKANTEISNPDSEKTILQDSIPSTHSSIINVRAQKRRLIKKVKLASAEVPRNSLDSVVETLRSATSNSTIMSNELNIPGLKPGAQLRIVGTSVKKSVSTSSSSKFNENNDLPKNVKNLSLPTGPEETGSPRKLTSRKRINRKIAVDHDLDASQASESRLLKTTIIRRKLGERS
ncbi:uncharacterized protein LOC108677263 [Hyalella azteca]|uniref:Uncharacterized protein LOC108677263 n=1 Tax=Hyalella azteca TaxID=294128 RepID=A0A8B7P4I0_HYAAZ|nr:uncharacterized protein LOC108677263 [Hyalella azteca]